MDGTSDSVASSGNAHGVREVHSVQIHSWPRASCKETVWQNGISSYLHPRKSHILKKKGALMAENDGKPLGLYNELSSFLTGVNLYNSKG